MLAKNIAQFFNINKRSSLKEKLGYLAKRK